MKNSLHHCILFFLINTLNLTIGEFDIFLVSPGDGEEFVYSPIGVNATLHCAVNSTNLLWVIDMRNFDVNIERDSLHSRGIYRRPPIETSEGIMESVVTVSGSKKRNNNTHICCRSYLGSEFEQACTILIIYGRPSPPKNVLVQQSRLDGIHNISWTATMILGVLQNYIVIFESHSNTTTNSYILYQQTGFNVSCGTFLAYVKAVNGAGESDPSNNVSIPSLPDIGPVTASLTHQVWKHDGEIRVKVLFESARCCSDYPVLSYLFLLRLSCTSSNETISVFLEANETEVILTPKNGLEADQKYEYRVTAVNAIGNVTSHQDGIALFTSDVQAVNVTVVDESAIAVQCLFIHGSDALGCKVVLVSKCQNVRDVQANLSRSDIFSFGQLNLTHSITCYHEVFAFDINVNNTFSNLSIEGKIHTTTHNVHTGDGEDSILAIAIVLPVMVLFMTVIVSLVLWKGKQHRLNTSTLIATSRNGKFLTSDGAESPPVQCADEKPSKEAPAIHSEGDYNCSEMNACDNEAIEAIQPPLYAIPDKLRSKESLGSFEGEMESDRSICQPTEKFGGAQSLQNEEEHFYHVLEISNSRAPNSNETILPDPDAPDLPPPLEPDSQDTDTPPVYQDINELSCKPNNMANCEQCCYQEACGVNDNLGTAKAHQQKGEDCITVKENQGMSDANPSHTSAPT